MNTPVILPLTPTSSNPTTQLPPDPTRPPGAQPPPYYPSPTIFSTSEKWGATRDPRPSQDASAAINATYSFLYCRISRSAISLFLYHRIVTLLCSVSLCIFSVPISWLNYVTTCLLIRVPRFRAPF